MGPAGKRAGLFFYVCAKTSCRDEIVHAIRMYAPQLSGLPISGTKRVVPPPQKPGHVLGFLT